MNILPLKENKRKAFSNHFRGGWRDGFQLAKVSSAAEWDFINSKVLKRYHEINPS